MLSHDNDNMRYRWSSRPADFGIDRIAGTSVPAGNSGYIAPLPSASICIADDSRRAAMLKQLSTREMRRPDHNLRRNEEVDEEATIYDNDGSYMFDDNGLEENFDNMYI